jgi:hypothetical protein
MNAAWIFPPVNVLLHAGVAASSPSWPTHLRLVDDRADRRPVVRSAPDPRRGRRQYVGRAELMCGLGMFARWCCFFVRASRTRRWQSGRASYSRCSSKEQGLLVA